MNTLCRSLLLFSLFIMSINLYAKPDKIKEILEKFDDMYRSSASQAKLEMVIETPHWNRTLLMKSWSKGTEKTLVRILKPKKERGVTSLKKGQEMWNFFPKINKVIKVPTSMMMGSWMGSDITNDDMVKEFRFSEDYSYEALETSQSIVITLKPKLETISLWGKIELFIDPVTSIPRKEIFYDEKMKKIRQINFKDIRKISGRSIPFIMELIPFNKSGHKTIIKYIELDFKTDIPDSFFSRKNLQKRI